MSSDLGAVGSLISAATSRPWEALDADDPSPNVYPWVGKKDEDGQIETIVETPDPTEIDKANVRLIVRAVNEYESLRAIGQYAKHLHGCARNNTGGGLFRPGECDCGLDDWLSKWKAASGE